VVRATYVTEIDWDGDLRFHPAAQFTLANSEYLSIADNSSLSTGDINFSAAIWVRLDTKATDQVLMGKWKTSGNLREWKLIYDTSDDRFEFYVSSNGTAETLEKADVFGSVAVDVWNFIVVRHDASGNTIDIRVNDGTADSQSYSSGLSDKSSQFEIGREGSASNYTNGRLNDVGFWKKVLSSAEMTSLYNKGQGLSFAELDGTLTTSLEAYWNLDEVSGTRSDSDGSNNLTDNNTVTQVGGGSDVTSLTLKASWSRGRDYASQLTGRSKSGKASFVINNQNGSFSPFNVSSALTGSLLPGRKMRIRTTSPTAQTIWQGFIDRIDPKPSVKGLNVCEIIGIGPLGYVNQEKVDISLLTTLRTDQIISTILDRANWPSADRSLGTGLTTITRFWTNDVYTMTALKNVEESELGFIYESKDGQIVFDDRQLRLKAAKLVSQATYTDDPSTGTLGFRSIKQDDPMASVFNNLEVKVRVYATSATGTLWHMAATGTDMPSIAASGTLELWASHPNDTSNTDTMAVETWITPSATLDWTFNENRAGTGTDVTTAVAITVGKFSEAMRMTFNNTGTLDGYLTKLQTRGVPLSVSTITIRETSSASQDKYGNRKYPSPAQFIPDVTEGLDHVRYLVSIVKEPVPILQVSFIANRDSTYMKEALTRDIGDRITVVGTGAAGLGGK